MALSMPSLFSCTNILHIVESDAEIYNFISLFLMGNNNIGGFYKYTISNVAKVIFFVLPLRFKMNLLNKFILPNRDRSCFWSTEALYWICSSYCSSLFWRVLLWTPEPKKSPAWTPKTHFNGFILSSYLFLLSKDCEGCLSDNLLTGIQWLCRIYRPA